MSIKTLFRLVLLASALLGGALAVAAAGNAPSLDELRAQAARMSQADVASYPRHSGTRVRGWRCSRRRNRACAQTFPTMHDHTHNLDAVIANCLLGADAAADAIARYRAAVRRNPADVEARLNLANRLVRDRQWAAAWDTLSAVEAGVQNGTLALSRDGTAILREYQGWTPFWGKQDYPAAAAYFEAAAARAPHRISVLEGVAWAYEAPGRQRNRAKSDAAWRALIAAYRKNPRILQQVMSSATAQRLKMIH